MSNGLLNSHLADVTIIGGGVIGLSIARGLRRRGVPKVTLIERGQFGAEASWAAGGILAEIHRDRSLRLAPVDLAEAQAMIGEVAALKALGGYRGKPAGDLNALAEALVALSQLAVVDGGSVAEAEVNPLIVKPKGEGVVAVDALVKLA